MISEETLEWTKILEMRVARLNRLLSLDAPPNVLLKEVDLVDQAISRVRVLLSTANDNVSP